MGMLFYGGDGIEIADRTLAHLQVAVVTKLRRNEGFTLTWTDGADDAPERTSLWMHPSIPLRFDYSETGRPQIEREVVERILLAASATGSIQLTRDEDQPVESDESDRISA